MVLTPEMGPDRQFETSYYRADRASMAATPERHWLQIHPLPRHALLSGPAALDPYHSGLWAICGLRIDCILGLLSLV